MDNNNEPIHLTESSISLLVEKNGNEKPKRKYGQLVIKKNKIDTKEGAKTFVVAVENNLKNDEKREDKMHSNAVGKTPVVKKSPNGVQVEIRQKDDDMVSEMNQISSDASKSSYFDESSDASWLRLLRNNKGFQPFSLADTSNSSSNFNDSERSGVSSRTSQPAISTNKDISAVTASSLVDSQIASQEVCQFAGHLVNERTGNLSQRITKALTSAVNDPVQSPSQPSISTSKYVSAVIASSLVDSQIASQEVSQVAGHVVNERKGNLSQRITKALTSVVNDPVQSPSEPSISTSKDVSVVIASSLVDSQIESQEQEVNQVTGHVVNERKGNLSQRITKALTSAVNNPVQSRTSQPSISTSKDVSAVIASSLVDSQIALQEVSQVAGHVVNERKGNLSQRITKALTSEGSDPIQRKSNSERKIPASRASKPSRSTSEDVSAVTSSSLVDSHIAASNDAVQRKSNRKRKISAKFLQKTKRIKLEGSGRSTSNIRSQPKIIFTGNTLRASQKRSDGIVKSKNGSQQNPTSINTSQLSQEISTFQQIDGDQNDSIANHSDKIVLNYSSEGTPPTIKAEKRKRSTKDFILVHHYSTYEEALREIKEENSWSVCSSKASYVLFRCNKVKKRGEQCKSGLRLEMHPDDLGVALFVSRNVHNCDQLHSANAKLTPEVKEFIANFHSRGLKFKAIQDEFIKAKKPLPAKTVLKNKIAMLQRNVTGRAIITLSELHTLLDQHLSIPDDEFTAYVLDYKIEDNDELRFDFVVSCKFLLDLNLKSQVCNADSTHKLIWQGYPVQVTGHTDYNKKFHPSSVSVSTNEDQATFAFLFDALKQGTKNALNKELKPQILICDAAKAISNGFREVFGDDFIELMCWYHPKVAMLDNIAHLIPKEYQDEVIKDIDSLQLAQNTAMFDKASSLFIEKYSNFPDFVDYFSQQWLNLHKNWYEGACVDRGIKAPSCNNGLEVFNRTIKDEKTLRQRLPLQQFINLLLIWMESWARRYEADASTYHTKVNIDLPMETKSYQWVKMKKEIRKHPSAGFYMVPADKDLTLDFWSDSLEWNSFDEYRSNVFKGWSITIIENADEWINGTCNCPYFLKHYMCKHICGIAMCLKLLVPRIEAKDIPLGQKRKRGRPKLARKALLRQ